MIVRSIWRALLLAALAGPAAAQEAPVFAEWAGFSGSLPPPYAWETRVAFHADGRVIVRHCKAYAKEPPGCATAEAQLAPDALVRLLAALAPLAAGFAAHPPEADLHPPVGGGSRFGSVVVEGKAIALPAFPAPADKAAVAAVLDLLAAATPEPAMTAAVAAAKQP